MARIKPFKAVRYCKTKIGTDVSVLITQPYDKITPDMQKKYYANHPHNFIRIELGYKHPSDDDYSNYYTRAAAYMQAWLDEGILRRIENDAIFAYHQAFEVDGKSITRKGFVALAELEPHGSGVKAHEKTLAGPKADRLNLTKHIRGQVGHIFMLYSDVQKIADDAIEAFIAGKTPDIFATDEYGVAHKMWTITDTHVIETVQKCLSDKTLFIADGHHRYETALNYQKYCIEKGLTAAEGNDNFNNQLMTFINMEDPGLVILPTHRVVHSVENFNVESLVEKLSVNFEIEDFVYTCGCVKFEVFQKAYARMESLGELGKHAFLMVPREGKKYFVLTLRDEAIMDQAITADVSAAWKRLDVSILHKLILEDHLGIDAKALEQNSNLIYIREREKGFDLFNIDARTQCVFYMNPTKIAEVQKIADAGERMPQKSTDFYPKLLTGMVFNKFIFAGDDEIIGASH